MSRSKQTNQKERTEPMTEQSRFACDDQTSVQCNASNTKIKCEIEFRPEWVDSTDACKSDDCYIIIRILRGAFTTPNPIADWQSSRFIAMCNINEMPVMLL